VLAREIDALDGVELATLSLGAYEFRDHLEIPYRVVLDEAIELAKHFGGADSHKYINGVLDRLYVGLPEEFDQEFKPQQADVLVANILAGPLMALAPEFAKLL
ncbi:transcription antitermination factor NusB, partial [Klebsiella pneumoniae]|uniref:transcription antitermination factor NusB n=1 Tax=Klebsiella pneumoniae TaxID=573 RepID=UPI001CC1CD05